MKKSELFYRMRCIAERRPNSKTTPPPTSCEMGIEELSFYILGKDWCHPFSKTQDQKTTMQVYCILRRFEELQNENKSLVVTARILASILVFFLLTLAFVL